MSHVIIAEVIKGDLLLFPPAFLQTYCSISSSSCDHGDDRFRTLDYVLLSLQLSTGQFAFLAWV